MALPALALATLLAMPAPAQPAGAAFPPEPGEECRPMDDPFSVLQPIFQRLYDVSQTTVPMMFFYTPSLRDMATSVGPSSPPLNPDPEGKVLIGPMALNVAAQTPDEVAFVLAHEMAHVKLDHGRLRARRFAQGFEELDHARRAGSMNADAAARRPTNSYARFMEEDAAWVRAQEREADREAVRLLKRARFDATAGASLLERLSRLTPERRHPLFHPLDQHDPHLRRAEEILREASPVRRAPVCE